MADIRLRPRFSRVVACPPRVVLERVGGVIGGDFGGTVFESSAVLKVHPDRQHFWSPQLELSVEALVGGSEVHGLFGPHPTVWSMFVAGYVAIGFAGTMGVVFGIAQWVMGDPAWALWSAPAAALLALGVWTVGRFGRTLGMKQVRELHGVVQAILDDCEAGQPKTDG